MVLRMRLARFGRRVSVRARALLQESRGRRAPPGVCARCSAQVHRVLRNAPSNARRQNLPFYRIFVAEAKAPRDGRHIDVVGHFDPHPGERA